MAIASTVAIVCFSRSEVIVNATDSSEAIVLDLLKEIHSKQLEPRPAGRRKEIQLLIGGWSGRVSANNCCCDSRTINLCRRLHVSQPSIPNSNRCASAGNRCKLRSSFFFCFLSGREQQQLNSFVFSIKRAS